MEGSDLTVVDLNTKDFLRQMGNCIQYGLPCLLQVNTVLRPTGAAKIHKISCV